MDGVSGIVSGKRFKYVMEGEVPPNVPDGLIEAAVQSSVSWTGNMLPFLKGATVELINDAPDVAGPRIVRPN
jgi:hypothetical protein